MFAPEGIDGDPENVPLPLPDAGVELTLSATTAASESASGQATAKRALKLLADHGYIVPTPAARRNLAMAFAGADKVVYGKAFDAVKIKGQGALDLEDLEAVTKHLGRVRLYEVKSTKRELASDFAGHFFSLSTAELLVAQSLGTQFGFVFVNVESSAVLELSLRELYAKAKAIYPGWSIRF